MTKYTILKWYCLVCQPRLDNAYKCPGNPDNTCAEWHKLNNMLDELMAKHSDKQYPQSEQPELFEVGK